MKIVEAQDMYRSQIKNYREHKASIAERQKKLQEQMEKNPDDKELFHDAAVTLQLTYDALDEKQTEYEEYMEKLAEQWAAEADKVSSKQQADAAADAAKDMAKIMEVARRIMKGHIVPASDEKKLMEFDDKLYQMAKNIGAMVKLREKKKYESLWDDEEQKEQEDPIEAADNAEVSGSGPEIVNASDIAAGAGVDLSAGEAVDVSV